LLGAIIQRLNGRKNQYIRSAIYSAIIKTNSADKYINYILEGLEIQEQNGHDRENVNLFDERSSLNECIASVKSQRALKKTISFISKNERFRNSYYVSEIFESTVRTAINLEVSGKSIFKSILSWYLEAIKDYRSETSELLISFFDETDTRERAFNYLWNNQATDDRYEHLAIAKLLDSQTLEFVVEQYKARRISSEVLGRIYFDMHWIGNPFRDEYLKKVNEKTDYKIVRPVYVDHNESLRKKTQLDFDTLFDIDRFKNSTLRIFENEGQDSFSQDELFGIRRENLKEQDFDDYYSGVGLSLLRDFSKNGVVKKDTIAAWFAEVEKVQSYQVYLIHQFLSNKRGVEVSEAQIGWIRAWCLRSLDNVNFKTAIKVKGETISINNIASYIWFFTKKFDLALPKNVMLDMLSFFNYESFDHSNIETSEGFSFILDKLTEDEVKDRIIENLQIGIEDSRVLKNHVIYALRQNLNEVYPIILKEIINVKRSDYWRRQVLDLYYDTTRNHEELKTIILEADDLIKWAIIDKIMDANDVKFSSKYLLKIVNSNNDIPDRIKASEYLIKLQNLDGLNFFTNWIINNSESPINDLRLGAIDSLNTIKALPDLLRLLEVSYVREIKEDEFQTLNYVLQNAFQRIALINESNFLKVKKSLAKFIKSNSILKNVNYLIRLIERIEEQYFLNKSQSYTISQIRNKLKLLK
jgi:hypothetical protein